MRPAFAEAGLDEPAADWTGADFDRIAHELAESAGEDRDVLQPRFVHGSHSLLMLIAAYGGLPIDFSADPIRYDFTSPETVDAIRQALDLAREGIIFYRALSRNSVLHSTSTEAILFTDPLKSELDERAGAFELVNFPRGRHGAPLRYSVNFGYISAESPHQRACFDWISALSERPRSLPGLADADGSQRERCDHSGAGAEWTGLFR